MKSELTPRRVSRQKQAVSLQQRGCTYAEIAKKMGISESTVGKHLAAERTHSSKRNGKRRRGAVLIARKYNRAYTTPAEAGIGDVVLHDGNLWTIQGADLVALTVAICNESGDRKIIPLVAFDLMIPNADWVITKRRRE